MNDADDSAQPPADPDASSLERDQRIRALEERLVQLHQQLDAARAEKSRALGETNWSKEPSTYERMRERLTAADQKMAPIADDIARTLTELREVQAEKPGFHAARTDPAARARAELRELERQLLAVADAQTEAVAAWNANPLPERRPGFEAELARLHAQFEALSAKKQALQGVRAG